MPARQQLIAMSGLPGSGKSALAEDLARRLGAPILSVDPIEAALFRSGISREQPTGLAAYVVVEVLAAEQLSLGMSVVIDAVNDVEAARDQWRTLARLHGVPLRHIEVRCPDERVHRHRLAGRTRNLGDFREPTWESVLERRPNLEVWSEHRLVVDSMQSRTDNLELALRYLHDD